MFTSCLSRRRATYHASPEQVASRTRALVAWQISFGDLSSAVCEDSGLAYYLGDGVSLRLQTNLPAVESRTDTAQTWPPMHWLEGPEIQEVANDFWQVRYDEDDLAMYNRFIRILGLLRDGMNPEAIGRTLQVNNARKYISGEKKSFLTHLRAERDRLGPPREGCKWLPLRLKPRGTPDRFWAEVPSSNVTFSQIETFVRESNPQLVNLQEAERFGFTSIKELESERMNLFGFLLGAAVGDAGKRAKGKTKFFSRSLSLELSKNKPNSLRFGEFTSLCANATLGLDMHRIGDSPVSPHRYGRTECYRWITRATPLLSWIFNGCLGLHDDETTTYEPLRMSWILDSTRCFRIHFLQGLTESDGWTDAGSDRAKFVSSPNTALLKELLETLGFHPLKLEQPPVQLLQITTEEADQLPLFSPRIASDLYTTTRVMALAKRFPERSRLPEDVIRMIRRLSETSTNANSVCLRLAKETGFKVSSQTVRKYLRQRDV